MRLSKDFRKLLIICKRYMFTHSEGRSNMKNKMLFAVAPMAFAAVLTACASGTATTTSTAAAGETTAAAGETTTAAAGETTAASGEAIRLVNGKIEIDKQLKELVLKYQEETGQEVIIESIGGGADIQATVKGYYQSGNMPDIIVIGGKGDFKTWADLAADLSDTEFAKDTDVAFKDDAGRVVGFPYAVEGYGITYNADILKAAGIDPASLTSYAAYEAAFKTLEEKKAELGLQAVISMAAESGQMYWSTGNHLFGYYLSGGVDREDKTYFNKFMAGEVDKERLTQFGKFFKLMAGYADPQVLISGTYDDQVSLWAQGKAAFITQGNWLDASFADYNISFETGIAPFAFTEEEMPGILADSPSWWIAYKDGKNVEGVKKFFDWLASSEVARKAMVEDMGMVSPYNSVSNKPVLPLAKSISSYIAAGNTYAWDWRDMPEGTAMQYTGSVFEAFAKDEIDLDTFVQMMEAQIKECIAAQQ